MTSNQWNLLVYAIDGKTFEPHVLQIIDDMRTGLTSDQCNIAVQVMAKSRTTRYWISARHKTQEEVLDNVVDASEPDALTSFINEASHRFPAASTALVLRAHATGLDNIHDYPKKAGGGLGGGIEPGQRSSVGSSVDRQAVLGHMALSGGYGRVEEPGRPESYGCRWGPDPNSSKYLTNIAMKKAIAASRCGHVNVLGLNACWMATLEIEYELRSVTDVVVASQVYAKSWPYRAIAESLSNDPQQNAEQLARTIVANVGSDIAAGKRQDAVSAFSSGSAMDRLAEAFDRYARRVTTLIDTDWEAVRDAVMTKVQRIDDPLQVDLISLTEVLGKHDPEAENLGDAVRTQFRSMCLANVAHPAHPGVHGMSIFCPKSLRVHLRDAYKGTEFRANGWASFLQEFQRRLTRVWQLERT